MTEAAFKNKKNTQAASDNRISTHPSYTEYSWETLIGNNRSKNTAARANAERMSSTAQNPRVGGTRPVNGTAAGARRTAPSTGGDIYSRKVGQSTRTAAPNRTASAAPTQKSRTKAAAAQKEKTRSIEKLRKKSIVAIHTIAVEKKYSFPISIVLIAICFTILIMTIITTSVQISEITSENSELQRRYDSMVSEENELRLLLETRDDLRVVETMAKEELGMVKKDQVERYYLTVHKEDRIEIVEKTEDTSPSFFDGIMSFGGSLVERIRGFFGM